MEIACVEALCDSQVAYLESAAATVATFLHTVLQRQRIGELLGIAEDAARQAQQRSLELQEVNTLLEEQQQQLQQQTEELQQSNAQMEEQQQQLQQQTEELQQANAQMEEQQQQLQQQTVALQMANARLEDQQHLLELRNRELEQASRYKSEFLANMSHELRTPLNSIILLAKMLAMNDGGHLDAEEVKRASVIHHAGGDLLTLINDILDLSKIEAGKMEVHPQPIASADLLAEIRQLFEDTAQARGVEFRTEDGWQGEFTSDHDKLGQILRNLLSNAFKFTRSGHVTLALRRGGDAGLPLDIAVSDSGIGIPADKLQIIFEAFQQVDGSIARQFGGTGLGLSISLRLAQLLGGTIQVASEFGVGSTFTLRLPAGLCGAHPVPAMTGTVAPVVSVAPEAFAATPPADPVPAAWVPAAPMLADDRADLKPGDTVILVVDDDLVFGETIRAINRRQGYKTLLAGSGAEGLRLAEAYRPSGILLDLGLPDLDGIEVLKRIKAHRGLRNIPVYVVSGRDRDPDLLQQGIVGYLTKPVDDRQILAAEAQVLQRAGTPVLVVLGGAGPGRRAHPGLGGGPGHRSACRRRCRGGGGPVRAPAVQAGPGRPGVIRRHRTVQGTLPHTAPTPARPAHPDLQPGRHQQRRRGGPARPHRQHRRAEHPCRAAGAGEHRALPARSPRRYRQAEGSRRVPAEGPPQGPPHPGGGRRRTQPVRRHLRPGTAGREGGERPQRPQGPGIPAPAEGGPGADGRDDAGHERL